MSEYTYQTTTLQKTGILIPKKFFGAKIGTILINNKSGETVQINRLPVINGREQEFPNYGGGHFGGALDVKIPATASGLVYITVQVFL